MAVVREAEASLDGFEEASGPSGGVNGPAGKSSWTEAGIATDSGITERLSRCWRREAYIDQEKRRYNLLPGKEGIDKKSSTWRRKREKKKREREKELEAGSGKKEIRLSRHLSPSRR